MKFQEIKNNIFYCGLNDCDRRIFDELIPLEHGTSYNSYLVKGSEKTAIIDTMYPPKTKEYLKRLADNQVGKVDYIVANHGEQDHSGSIPALLEKYPNAVVLTNPKVAENIKSMLHVPAEKIQVIADGEEVSLGDKTPLTHSVNFHSSGKKRRQKQNKQLLLKKKVNMTNYSRKSMK